MKTATTAPSGESDTPDADQEPSITATSNPDDPCAGLKETVSSAATPREKCRALVAKARCILVVACAPLLDEQLRGNTINGVELARLAAEGMRLLDLGVAALEQADKENAGDVTSEWQPPIDLLRSFGEVFAALGGDIEKPEDKQRLIDACSDLAPYFDDNDKAVAESAKFWQAVAYRRAGRPDRALQILRPVLSPPASGRIGFFARLERCRALADRNEHPAAIALALRLGSRVDSWFDDDPPEVRTDAAESIKSLRADLYLLWSRKLRADGKTQEADAAAKEADRLTDRSATGHSGNGLMLVEAIAGVPEIEPEGHTVPPTDDDDP